MTSTSLAADEEKASQQKGRQFDLTFWTARVAKQHARLIKKGVSAEFAMKQYLFTMSHVRALNKIIGWCDKRGLTVYFRRHENGSYSEAYKTITIAANALPAKQVAYLLHECGHHLISQHASEPNRFLMGYGQTDSAITRTFQHRLACLEEEIEAWHRGMNLAKKLKLRFDDDIIDFIRVDCLKSYIKWTVKMKGNK
jgi:hypothetical protein